MLVIQQLLVIANTLLHFCDLHRRYWTTECRTSESMCPQYCRWPRPACLPESGAGRNTQQGRTTRRRTCVKHPPTNHASWANEIRKVSDKTTPHTPGGATKWWWWWGVLSVCASTTTAKTCARRREAGGTKWYSRMFVIEQLVVIANSTLDYCDLLRRYWTTECMK